MTYSPMIRLGVGVLVALALSGCATFSGQAPTCDGASRRPLNRSLWQWENALPAGSSALAAPRPPEQSPQPQVAATGASGSAPVESARPPDASSPALPAGSPGGDRVGAIGPERIDVAASLHACGDPEGVRHG